jgi:hypothetical protein
MKKNMGSADRIIRLILAVGFVTLYLTGVMGGALGLILICLSAMFFITSLFSFCPMYMPFGLTSLGRKKTPAGSNQ